MGLHCVLFLVKEKEADFNSIFLCITEFLTDSRN